MAIPWLDNAASDGVNLFWRCAGAEEPFPRSLEQPLALALPVALVKLPRLRLRDVEYWLRVRGAPFSFNCKSRSMRGCLVAFAGNGVIFLDGADPVDEQRVSLAHEIAHFLVDYWFPRRRAVERYGPQILDAFDGKRPPTFAERLFGVIDGAMIGPQTDLLERNAADDSEKIWQVENRADRVAMALLAPPERVLDGLDLAAPEYSARLDLLVRTLGTGYALPAQAAKGYAAELLLAVGKGPSWVDSLRQAISQQNVELGKGSSEK